MVAIASNNRGAGGNAMFHKCGGGAAERCEPTSTTQTLTSRTMTYNIGNGTGHELMSHFLVTTPREINS